MGTARFVDLPDDVCGYYDHGSGDVCVDPRMSPDAIRSTLAHEMVHRILGHGPATGPARVQQEMAVDRIAARMLIPFPSLLEALVRFRSRCDMARFLQVDEDTLLARMLDLDGLEQTIVGACARHCIGVGTPQASRGAPVAGLGKRPGLAVVA